MLAEQKELEINNNLKFSTERGFHQIRILAFIRTCLPVFAREFIGTSVIAADQNINDENYISQELSVFFNNRIPESGYIFMFEAKGPDIFVRQAGSKVHGPTLLFMEAKRLPPTDSQDYVKEGIGRFKRETHGKECNIAAMLGYVQEDDFDHWFNRINSWIITLISKEESPKWSAEEQISKIQIADIGEYKSTHSRINEKPITLYHFWINLCMN